MTDLQKIAAAIERLAIAHEKIAEVLKDEAKIGGALWALGQIPTALNNIALEISNDPRRV